MKSYILIGHYPAVDLVVMLDKTMATPLFRIGWTLLASSYRCVIG